MLIDLSHPIRDRQPVFPGDPAVRIAPHGTVASCQYNIAAVSMGTHTGTHLDAPRHFYDRGRAVDRIPLDRLYGPAVLVDLAPAGRLKSGTPITPEMLQAHARAFRPGARVIYRTGWDRYYGRPRFFQDFPSLTLEAAQWIASRRIALLGMDTPSPSERWLEVHRALLAKFTEIVIVECLANLSRLPPRFTFIGLPLRLERLDGSPIRAAAVVKDAPRD